MVARSVPLRMGLSPMRRMLRLRHWCPPYSRTLATGDWDTPTYLIRRLLVPRGTKTPASIQILAEKLIENQSHFKHLLPPLRSSKCHRMRNDERGRAERSFTVYATNSLASCHLHHSLVVMRAEQSNSAPLWS